jgi:hypothetical protein
MNIICLSASLRFVNVIRETIQKAEELGIQALFPNLDSGLDKNELTVEVMKKLCQDHFHAITRAEALYVINPRGYIGTLVKIEIGYALGKKKPVYYSHKTGSLDLDSLPNGTIPLNSIEQFLHL